MLVGFKAFGGGGTFQGDFWRFRAVPAPAGERLSKCTFEGRLRGSLGARLLSFSIVFTPVMKRVLGQRCLEKCPGGCPKTALS